jgi:hypothetical protein
MSTTPGWDPVWSNTTNPGYAQSYEYQYNTGGVPFPVINDSTYLDNLEKLYLQGETDPDKYMNLIQKLSWVTDNLKAVETFARLKRLYSF